MARYLLRLITVLFLLTTTVPAVAGLFDKANQFVSAEQAFRFDFQQQQHRLLLSWKIKPGYYLYQQKITFSPYNMSLARWQLPTGTDHQDEFFGKTVIYSHDLQLPLTVNTAGPNATLTITWQGCAEAGFCYPLQTQQIPIDQLNATTTSIQPSLINTEAVVSKQQPANQNNASQTLPFTPLWALLIGIGVAFTPCVLPMYPLISGIILGSSRPRSLLQLLIPGVAYTQGMALTYTLLGIVVASLGVQMQAWLQSASILIGLSLLFIILALSMFGLFSLQLPASIQTRLTLWSNSQSRTAIGGIFIMGCLAGLICSPCTTAPLTAILLYIAQTGNVATGALTLYLYALGMGLPLLIVVLFGNKLLPKSGAWMQTIKQGFGFIILALPVFLLERIIGESWGLRLWSLLGISFFGWAFSASLHFKQGVGRWSQIIWLALALIAARPLQDWIFSPANIIVENTRPLFEPVADYAQLRAKLQQNNGKITMLDLYADWCVACKEFEKYTFTDAGVKTELGKLQRLTANFTTASDSNRQFQQQLSVLGLPSILFFDGKGQEIPGSRINGFMPAAAFLQHLQQLPQTGDQ